MATQTNIGKQIVTTLHSQAAKGATFNQVNYKLVPPGIYDGGDLVKVEDPGNPGSYLANRISVEPFVLFIEDPNFGPAELPDGVDVAVEDSSQRHYIAGVGVRIQTEIAPVLGTGTTYSKSGDSTNGFLGNFIHPDTPYLIGRYVWEERADNFLKFETCDYTYFTNHPNAIMFGRVIFNGAGDEITGFDYSLKSIPATVELRNNQNNLKIIPLVDEGFPNAVRVFAGSFLFNNRYYTFDGGDISVDPTLTLARHDLVTITTTATPSLQVVYGTESATPTAPQYPFNALVVAEIRRGAGRTDINGNDIIPILKADGLAVTNLPWASGDGQVNSALIPLGADINETVTGGTDFTISRTSFLPAVFTTIIQRFKQALGLENNVIKTRHIDSAQITEPKMDDNSISTRTVVDGNITTVKTDAVSAATPNLLMKRDSSGRSQVVGPSATADIANKGYVDGVASGLTSDIDDVDSTLSSHIAGTSVHGATSSATANRIAIRDSSGRTQVAGASSANDAVNLTNLRTYVGGDNYFSSYTGQFATKIISLASPIPVATSVNSLLRRASTRIPFILSARILVEVDTDVFQSLNGMEIQLRENGTTFYTYTEGSSGVGRRTIISNQEFFTGGAIVDVYINPDGASCTIRRFEVFI